MMRKKNRLNYPPLPATLIGGYCGLQEGRERIPYALLDTVQIRWLREARRKRLRQGVMPPPGNACWM